MLQHSTGIRIWYKMIYLSTLVVCNVLFQLSDHSWPVSQAHKLHPVHSVTFGKINCVDSVAQNILCWWLWLVRCIWRSPIGLYYSHLESAAIKIQYHTWPALPSLIPHTFTPQTNSYWAIQQIKCSITKCFTTT